MVGDGVKVTDEIILETTDAQRGLKKLLGYIEQIQFTILKTSKNLNDGDFDGHFKELAKQASFVVKQINDGNLSWGEAEQHIKDIGKELNTVLDVLEDIKKKEKETAETKKKALAREKKDLKETTKSWNDKLATINKEHEAMRGLEKDNQKLLNNMLEQQKALNQKTQIELQNKQTIKQSQKIYEAIDDAIGNTINKAKKLEETSKKEVSNLKQTTKAWNDKLATINKEHQTMRELDKENQKILNSMLEQQKALNEKTQIELKNKQTIKQNKELYQDIDSAVGNTINKARQLEETEKKRKADLISSNKYQSESLSISSKRKALEEIANQRITDRSAILRIEAKYQSEALASKAKAGLIDKKSIEYKKEELAIQQKLTSATQMETKAEITSANAKKKNADYDKILSMHAAKRAVGYSALFAGIFAVTSAVSATVDASIAYDDALYNNMSVLNMTSAESKELADDVRDLSKAYGGSIREIDELALTLGRAGIANEDISEATKASVELAKITGDSFSDSSKVMSTFITTFKKNAGELGVSVGDISKKLAYMANESKMSVQDLGTFSNYALQASESLGLTIDSVGVLSTTFSNLGMNASTIGTQMRKMEVLFKSTGTNVKNFWKTIGEDQNEFANGLRKDSMGTITEFAEKLRDLPEGEFISATRNMEIQTRTLVTAFRNGADTIVEHSEKIKFALDPAIQAMVKSLGASTMIERAWNSVITGLDGVLTSIADSLGRKDINLIYETYQKNLKELGELRTDLSYASTEETRDNIRLKITKQENQLLQEKAKLYVSLGKFDDSKVLSGKDLSPIQSGGLTEEQRDSKRIAYLVSNFKKEQKLEKERQAYRDKLRSEGKTTEYSLSDSERTNLDEINRRIKELRGESQSLDKQIVAKKSLISDIKRDITNLSDSDVDAIEKAKLIEQQVIQEKELLNLQNKNKTAEEKRIKTLNTAKLKTLELDNDILVASAKINGERLEEKELAKKLYEIELQKAEGQAKLGKYQEATKTALEAQVDYQNSLKDIEEKRSKVVEDTLKKQIAYQEKLNKIRTTDYRGIGKSRSQEVSSMQGQLNTLNSKGVLSEDDMLKREELTYQLTEAQRKLNDAVGAGASDAYEKYRISAEDTYSQIESLTTKAFQGMEDALVTFATTGKLSFKDLANSIISDLIRIQIRQALVGSTSGSSGIFGTIASGIGGWFSGSVSPGGTGTYTNAELDLIPSGFAKGGAFQGGLQKFATGGAFTNSIVNSPTTFPMANGRTGLMGEAGAEAIVPLERIDGSLGVKSRASKVVLNIENNTSQGIEAEMLSEMTKQNSRGEEEKIINIVMKNISTNSNFRNTLKGLK